MVTRRWRGDLPFYRLSVHGRRALMMAEVSPAFVDSGGTIMASTRRRKLKKLRMKKANHGKRPLAGK
ncbi:MAG: hypothetical protein ACRDFX_03830 [Chloroflexota bacterium]